MLSASLWMPSDCPLPTWSQQIGGLAELWALPSTTQAPDPPSARLYGWMAPLPRSFGASTPSHSLHQLMPFASMGGEWHSPHHFVPFASTGGGCTPLAGRPQPPTGATPHGRQGTMAPLPITTGAARPSPSLARPFLLTQSSPSHPPTMGGSAALAASRALDQQLQRLAYNFYLGFADRNPWVMNRLYAVALDLQCWYQ
jgi:hypothetical protein